MKVIVALALLSVLCCIVNVQAEDLMNDILGGLENEEQKLETREIGGGLFECYIESDGSDYRGGVQSTFSGLPCQMWTSDMPHDHNRTPENYPNAGLGYHNCCRNPDGSAKPWCYTNAWNQRWEYCEVGSPQKACGECYTRSDGADYVGTVSTTEGGKDCQKWSSQSPHSHGYSDTGDHNYCRNPDGSSRAWCYTTDEDKRWDYCNIGNKRRSCPKLRDDAELLAECMDQWGVDCQLDADHCEGIFGISRHPCPKTCGACT